MANDSSSDEAIAPLQKIIISTDLKDLAIMDVEEFAIAFAVAVTEASDPAVEVIAKNGKHSIFSLLQGIFPQASV